MKHLINAFAALLFGACAATGERPQSVVSRSSAETQAPVEYLAVFNKPGPAWAERGDHTDALAAHATLYRSYAASGDILVGGRFGGEPILGLSVFREGIDGDAVRTAFEDDPAVRAGVIEIEFRQWSVQMGGLD